MTSQNESLGVYNRCVTSLCQNKLKGLSLRNIHDYLQHIKVFLQEGFRIHALKKEGNIY